MSGTSEAGGPGSGVLQATRVFVRLLQLSRVSCSLRG